MSESIWTSMTIGGNFDPALSKELMKAVANEFYEYSNDPLENGKVFKVEGQVNWGTPNDVIDLCKKHQLTYRYYNDSCVDSGPSVAWWAPGMKEEMSVYTDQDGRPVTSVENAAEIIRILLILARKGEAGLPLCLHISENFNEVIKKVLSGKVKYDKALDKWAKELLPPVPPTITPITFKV